MKKNFRSFEEAREFVRELNLKNSSSWFDYCKSGKKPKDIPTYLKSAYKKEWKGYGNFLEKKYRSSSQAKQFVQSLRLKGYKEWLEYCKSGKKPKDIPASPNKIYEKDWKGWGDFFGTGNIHKKNFRSFSEAKKFVKSLGLNGIKEWNEYHTSGNKPEDIPSAPNNTYKKEWESWGDFLGTGNTREKPFRSFSEARKFVQSLGLKGVKDWNEYYKSEKKPDDIPSSPNSTYKKEWRGFGDWLGTGNIREKPFRSFTEARKFVQSLGLKGQKEWVNYTKSGKKPEDIPTSPHISYKKEWKGSGDFLGTGRIATQDIQYRSFSEAKKFVQSLGLKSRTEWQEYCKSGNKPDDIPSTPWIIYKEWKDKKK